MEKDNIVILFFAFIGVVVVLFALILALMKTIRDDIKSGEIPYMIANRVLKEMSVKIQEDNSDYKKIKKEIKFKAKNVHSPYAEKEALLYGNCPCCGKVVCNDNIYCSKCGTQLDWEEDV